MEAVLTPPLSSSARTDANAAMPSFLFIFVPSIHSLLSTRRRHKHNLHELFCQLYNFLGRLCIHDNIPRMSRIIPDEPDYRSPLLQIFRNVTFIPQFIYLRNEISALFSPLLNSRVLHRASSHDGSSTIRLN